MDLPLIEIKASEIEVGDWILFHNDWRYASFVSIKKKDTYPVKVIDNISLQKWNFSSKTILKVFRHWAIDEVAHKKYLQ